LAKPNYQYEKRQRELAKKAKKAEKAARKSVPSNDASDQSAAGGLPPQETEVAGGGPAGTPPQDPAT